MLFKKDEKNLSVEIIDIKLDTSDVPSIKEEIEILKKLYLKYINLKKLLKIICFI